MATITGLTIDVQNEKLLISATNTDVESGSHLSYRFNEVSLDTSDTFVCKDDPSTNANTVEINFSSTNDYDKDLTRFAVPFSEIYSDDVPNDLIFIWLKELTLVNCYNSTTDNQVYLKWTNNGVGYYLKFTALADGTTGSSITSTAYENAASNASTTYIGKSYYYEGYVYIHYIDSTDSANPVSTYYMINTTNNQCTETTKDEFCAHTDQVAENLFGVTLSVSTLYKLLLSKIEIQDSNCCNIGCSEVDFMLAWQGFNLAKNLAEYRQMIKFWKILHNTNTTVSSCCSNS